MTADAAVARSPRRSPHRPELEKPSPRRRWALVGLVLTGVGLVCGVITLVEPGPGPLHDGVESSLCYLVPYGLAGAFLISRRPDLPFGWLLSGTAAGLSVSLASQAVGVVAIRNGAVGSWLVPLVSLGSAQFAAVAVQGLINVRFPSGRVESRLGRWLDRLMIAGLVLAVLGGLLGGSTAASMSESLPRPVVNPITGTGPVADVADQFQATVPLIILLGLVAGIRIVVLAGRAHGLERQQLRWRAAGVVVALALFPFAVAEVLPRAVDFLDGTVFVATLAIPVLRYRLWEIDTVIRRSVAYGLATVVLAAGYLAVASVGAAVATERAGIVVAAFVVALAFAPALSASRRVIDRLFYGLRDDPYRALREVSRRLAAVSEPGTVLPAVVGGVAASLRLPYVAIERPGDGVVVAAHGARPAVVADEWPLHYRGAVVGTLVAAPRSGETAFGRRDRNVLGDLARQLGAAVHAEALTADLLESRQRLVTAREDERRRLRRELHDGLGPMLTGLGLNVDAARARLARGEPDAADTHLASVKETSSRAITDLRGIVYGLRPPAVDDLGLVGAVRTHAQRLVEGVATTVTVVADELGELPAAVEVAAFRISVEAVSNAVRHAGAGPCVVRFAVTPGALVVEVTDGSAPGAAGWTAGVGILGMRERAAELGGSLDAGPTADGGRVRAVLPLMSTPTGGAP